MTLKSLLIFSISISLVLIASTLYIAEKSPDGSNENILNSTAPRNGINFQNDLINDPDPSTIPTFNPKFNASQSNRDPHELGETNLSENKPLITGIINIVLEVLSPTENPAATSEGIDEQVSNSYHADNPPSSLDQVVNNPNRVNFNELMDNAPLSDSQLSTIGKYSGGMNPMELVDQFCGEVRSGEFHNMTEDIRRSYNYNPASPALLMSIFEKMGDLCP